jgi:hypothetical protein
MITKQICKRCGNTISVLQDGFQFYRTDAYNGSNLYENQCVCPYCGTINNFSENNKYSGLKFSRKSILRSFAYSMFGWFLFGYVAAITSIKFPADFKNLGIVLQQQYIKEMTTFPWLYGLICIGFALLNIVILYSLIKSRYEFDFISQNDLMPIGQIVTMFQTLLIFIIISLCSSYFILPQIIPENLILNTTIVRLFLGGFSGALASSWSHGMFFRECRK